MRIRRRQTEIKRQRAKQLRAAATPAEVALWMELRKLEASFTRQFVIEGFIVDFCCRSARLVVEVDGDVHDEQVEYDEARDRVLQTAGYRVVRFRNDRVLADATAVAAEIERLVID